MNTSEIRKTASRAGHNLSPFKSVPMGIGPVATCDCGLGVTQQRRGPGRGATLVWHLGKQGHAASPGVVRAVLSAECPNQVLS